MPKKPVDRQNKTPAAKPRNARPDTAGRKQKTVEREPEARTPLIPGDPEAQSVRNPGRTSDDELDARIDATELMLAKGYKKSDIKRAIANRYGVSARTTENYLARAREKLLSRLAYEQEEHRAASLAFYQTVLGDGGATLMEKLRAQSQIDRLLGLSSPIRVAQTNTKGEDLSIEQARTTLSTIAERLLAMEDTEDAEDANAVREFLEQERTELDAVGRL